MPSIKANGEPSAKQHRAMEAAAHGHSTLGIPQSVGKDFAAADEALPKGTFSEKKSKHADFTKAMKSHGVAKGDGKHKRHPSTGHYGMGPKGNRFG